MLNPDSFALSTFSTLSTRVSPLIGLSSKPPKPTRELLDLRRAFDKMSRYGLKMNPHKCVIGVSTSKFLGFIIHEHSIEVDLDRIRAIRNVGTPACKLEMQKFLIKINYLRRFISNLANKVDAFTPIL